MSAGCAKKTGEAEVKIPDEELYIDAKLGFTIQHPLNWERIKVPVSSPSYRRDSVTWDIPDQEETGIMLIRVYPLLSSSAELPELLDRYFKDNKSYPGSEVISYLHDSGAAISTTVSYPEYKERLFAIQGSRNSYILSYYFRNMVFERQVHLFERSVESFREL